VTIKTHMVNAENRALFESLEAFYDLFHTMAKFNVSLDPDLRIEFICLQGGEFSHRKLIKALEKERFVDIFRKVPECRIVATNLTQEDVDLIQSINPALKIQFVDKKTWRSNMDRYDEFTKINGYGTWPLAKPPINRTGFARYGLLDPGAKRQAGPGGDPL
jgi:hypothetical protein